MKQNKDWIEMFREQFRYKNWTFGGNRLERKIIRRGVEVWITATDKQVLDFIQQTIDTQVTIAVVEKERKNISKKYIPKPLTEKQWKQAEKDYLLFFST